MSRSKKKTKDQISPKSLKENWSYFALTDDIVLAVKASVTEAQLMKDKDGAQIKDDAGKPAFKLQVENVTKLITRKEYDSYVA